MQISTIYKYISKCGWDPRDIAYNAHLTIRQYTDYTPSAMIDSRQSPVTVDHTSPRPAFAARWQCKQQTDCSCCASPNGLCAVAKFSKSELRTARGNTLTFGDTLISLQYSAAWVEENPCAKNQLDPSSHYDTVPACDRHTHTVTHATTANTHISIALRYKLQTTSKIIKQ